ncbi:GrpB family protein [Caldalkalibacillus mannanilyticus]|uniref:GrpB family protein n=1 Tax=Caldalkalibacillus mannanilyticus TaxID=1418 RepID=UPI0004694168|nr:GrpB family protein [Caldalkalibacillus mannanilyticus]
MKSNHDESTWPIWANEEINIVQPNPNWIERGVLEKELLLHHLAQFGVTEVEHYGSTSIPFLPAKPIIDVMAKIDSFEKIGEIASILAPHDWNYVPPELDGRPWQRFFVKVKNDKRVAHLHIMLEEEIRWDMQLLFRERLRNNPQLITEYASLKQNLAEMYNNDREAYTKAKTEFIKYVLDSKE